ncbi:hypothetical protein [Actinoalloteichus caeruleus]|uniref:hypothetical protein n=1 Tax=Actinoalloteichus cyanogriseus TaxID=2893586 RepID=UPI000AC00A6C|nr:hypothetical protein [Actinoalloteichus caeruleus]
MSAVPPDVVMPGEEAGRLTVWWPAQYRTARVFVEVSRLGVVLRPAHAPAEPVGLPPLQARRVAGALLVAEAETVATAITAGPGLVASLMVTSLPGLAGKVLTLSWPEFPPVRWVLPTRWAPTRPGGLTLTHPKVVGELIGRAAGVAEALA